MRSVYDKIYDKCAKLSAGQHFDFMRYDQCVKKPVILKHVIRDKDFINDLYKTLLKSPLRHIDRTKGGSIRKSNIHHAAGAWDIKKVYTEANVFKGVIITVVVKGTVFVFKCGQFGVQNSEMTGRRAFRIFEKECERQGIDLAKYAVSNGKEIKAEIQSPIIRVFNKYRELGGVHHLDLNSAWASNCCAKYPELKPVFETLYKRDKMIVNMALGFCQSQYCGYKYSELPKAGINGTNDVIFDLISKMTLEGFEVVGVNTDGIWYNDPTGQNRLYTDENEGEGFGKWKTDHKNCVFDAYGDGQYWFEENGEFNVRARGYYLYEAEKPRDQWDKVDFDKAMAGVAVLLWDDEEGFVSYEKSYCD